MAKPQVKNLQPEQMLKVQTFIEAEERLQAFKVRHYEVYQELVHIIDEYNAAREDAEKEVRARAVNCGPFTVCGEQSRVDVQKLYDELGEEDFLRVGGTIETRKVYDIDKRKFEALVDSNSIPKDVVDAVLSRSLKYKGPGKVELP